MRARHGHKHSGMQGHLKSLAQQPYLNEPHGGKFLLSIISTYTLGLRTLHGPYEFYKEFVSFFILLQIGSSNRNTKSVWISF